MVCYSIIIWPLSRYSLMSHIFFNVNVSITLKSKEVLIWCYLTASEANIFNFSAIIPVCSEWKRKIQAMFQNKSWQQPTIYQLQDAFEYYERSNTYPAIQASEDRRYQPFEDINIHFQLTVILSFIDISGHHFPLISKNDMPFQGYISSWQMILQYVIWYCNPMNCLVV